ncbi:DNA mismatch repair endonuclease MutL [Flammeovirga kamogawensis]|uniref:DNA mismatch repair protein MutL n=1 Tax=Flammeovirga kamogawensis TaxID=373891 RepID=A0ABX8GSL5_9BACT|nr:DNA mismatch repair endonuclease MutL [Flammeovirga kamogawensis]MBB6463826.1 DNA mismatch repair protein MutL [Flammeovirga kamogawensis]QWG06157.1 DNA mismatch repair endonuclease MutL [Flammeovirga kamogawensis]TRX67988.1 DNA mismatch repair endonuclease MutL [Flammeovirga kamogawensis]
MQDVIRLLPESLANQIAAGEVVQRPASVVKELVENAIDAGSDSIVLKVKDAGKTLIQVIDNGIGMSETDVRMSFERHATSKILSSDDLFNINTFGFRGEALASIAAVAQVVVKTKKEDDEIGTTIEIEGSEIKKQEPISTPKGTSFSVKNLFFNVPARRKFLKSNPVELKHIIDEFQRVALAHPEISMLMISDDKEIYNLRAGNIAKRIVSMFGKSYQEQLYPCQEDLDVIKVRGYIGKPENAKKTRGEQFFFVNGRYIKHSALNHAIMTAYDSILPESHFPFYLLYIEIDPSDVDVNVHPTKTEVKFADERTTYAIVSAAVKQALASYGVAPSIDFGIDVNFAKDRKESILGSNKMIPPLENDLTSNIPDLPAPSSNDFSSASNSLDNFSVNVPFDQSSENDDFVKVSSRLNTWNQPSSDMPDFTPWNPIEMDDNQSSNNFSNSDSTEQSLTYSSRANDLDNSTEKDTTLEGFPSDNVIPIQLHNKYIMYQVKSGVMWMDQEAAHERILYEKFLSQIENTSGVSQQLLFPKTVQLNPSDFALFSDFATEIAALGFNFKVENDNTILINGVPAIIQGGDEQEILEELFEQIKHNQEQLRLSSNENIARALAKRASIKSGQLLELQEMKSMIEQLFSCSSPNYTPDGKKTVVLMDTAQIEGMFNIR